MPFFISSRIIVRSNEMVAALISTLDTDSLSSGRALGTKSVDCILFLVSASRSGVPSGAVRFALPDAIGSKDFGFKRVLHWNPFGRRRVGRPKNSWDTILENFCRLKGLPSWEVAAMDQDLWSSSLAEFLHFCK